MDSRRQREAWFSERGAPLLSKMVEDMIVEQPDSPRKWIAGYVDRDEDASVGKGAKTRRRSPPPASTKNRAAAAIDTTETSNQKKEEADTEDPEDAVDLNVLLLPSGGALPLDVERFSVSYSRVLLAGWVKQGSPCCAAASVAGAWNALAGRSRSDAGALSSETVLGAMRVVIEDQIAAMTARFERLLGGSLEPLLQAVRVELALEGKHLGGRGLKTAVAKGPHLLRLTRSITCREREQAGHSATFDRLWELYEDERQEASALTATASVEPKTSAGYVTASTTAAGTACGVSSATVAWTEALSGNTPAGSAVVGGDSFLHGDADGSARLGAVNDDGRSTDDEKSTASTDARAERDENETDVQRSGDVGGCEAYKAAAAKRLPRRPSSGRARGATPAADRPGSSLRRPRSATSLISNRASLDGEHRMLREQTAATGTGGGGASRHWWGGDAEGKWTGCVMGEGRGEEVDDEEEEEEEEETKEKEGEDFRGGSRVDRRDSRGSGRTKAIPTSKKSRKSGDGGTRRGTRGAGGATWWAWKKDLCDLLKRIGGLDKLCATSPSTGAFGNLGVMSTVRYLDGILADSENAQVAARLFMGKGKARSSKLTVPLSTRDGEEDKAKQWAALREAFLVDRQVLLFHLSNHYALIFALREWRSTSKSASSDRHTPTGTSCAAAAATAVANGNIVPCDGVSTADNNNGACRGVDAVESNGTVDGGSPHGWTRQILTARRGQRPTAWINFEEARRTMLGWEGYKILTVQRCKVSHSAC